MKFLGVGLTKTGTTSLYRAALALGMKSIHWDTIRLTDILTGDVSNPDFRRYDDVDLVCDLPSAMFWRELLEAYPEAKAILTVRDENAWWESIRKHFNERTPPLPPRVPLVEHHIPKNVLVPLASVPDIGRMRGHEKIRMRIRIACYGSDVAIEYLYRKRYREHNEAVMRDIPADRLLVMNISEGDGWEKLCPFLGHTVPTKPFPHANRAK